MTISPTKKKKKKLLSQLKMMLKKKNLNKRSAKIPLASQLTNLKPQKNRRLAKLLLQKKRVRAKRKRN